MARMKKSRGKRRNRVFIHPKIMQFKKWLVALFGPALMLLCSIQQCQAEDIIWQISDYGIDEVKIKAICVLEKSPDIVFAAGDRGIYKSIDAGENWVKVYMLTGERRGVNNISYNPVMPSIIYAATSDGLYASFDTGESWQKKFHGKDDMQRDIRCISLSEYGDIIFIGTARGLFQSNDYGANWLAEDCFVNKGIKSLVAGKGFYYACADDGVYYKDAVNKDWDKVYNLTEYREEIEESEYSDDPAQDMISSNLNTIAVYKGNVYITAEIGILYAPVAGTEWLKMNSQGLKSKRVNHMIAEKETMFAAGPKGVFKYNHKEDVWVDCSLGLATLNINMIDMSAEKKMLFAATEKGLFKARFDNNSLEKPEIWPKSLILKEPSISDIQQAAIDYAEVSPDKIKWMRNAARQQALMPSFSFNLNRDISRNINLDRGGTNDPDFFIEGPIDKKWGWGIGLSWNLGELLWSYHQTSIDVRSRLMVQLRNDILDEVTKLYFERIRLENEIKQGLQQDDSQIILKQLRLAELTANIDALTGGYLSRHIE
jgi:photosystem II stability/assembly factor-like uncharacterized protein